MNVQTLLRTMDCEERGIFSSNEKIYVTLDSTGKTHIVTFEFVKEFLCLHEVKSFNAKCGDLVLYNPHVPVDNSLPTLRDIFVSNNEWEYNSTLVIFDKEFKEAYIVNYDECLEFLKKQKVLVFYRNFVVLNIKGAIIREVVSR